MRSRLMATYRGVPYEAGVGPSGSDVVLFAACPPPEELGFEPATGHWRKRVIRAEVDALWESRPVGTFRNEPCMVLDDLGDRLHIAYLGADTGLAASLGYWQGDRGRFEVVTPRPGGGRPGRGAKGRSGGPRRRARPPRSRATPTTRARAWTRARTWAHAWTWTWARAWTWAWARPQISAWTRCCPPRPPRRRSRASPSP